MGASKKIGQTTQKEENKRAIRFGHKKSEVKTSLLVAGTRVELVTSGLWIRRSNQLSYPAICLKDGAKVSLFFELRKFVSNLFYKFYSHPIILFFYTYLRQT